MRVTKDTGITKGTDRDSERSTDLKLNEKYDPGRNRFPVSSPPTLTDVPNGSNLNRTPLFLKSGFLLVGIGVTWTGNQGLVILS